MDDMDANAKKIQSTMKAIRDRHGDKSGRSRV